MEVSGQPLPPAKTRWKVGWALEPVIDVFVSLHLLQTVMDVYTTDRSCSNKDFTS